MAPFFPSSKYAIDKAVFLVCILVCYLVTTQRTLAEKYTPDHPVVQEMIRKGVAFLSARGPRVSGGLSEGVGVLTGYAIYKVDGNPEHPMVASAIAEARQIAVALASGRNESLARSMYLPSVAAMLLASVDVQANASSIIQIRDFLLNSQKPHGGFGYTVGGQYLGSGDISQTQYVMLCLWTMNQLGIDVPDKPIVDAIHFLNMAQINDGGWPYQSMGTGIEVAGATNSLSAAGLSALLIAGDLLGMYRSKVAENQEEEGIIPIAFKRIMPESQRAKLNFDRTRADTSVRKGENWHNANPYRRAQWHYYYVYSRERYESFLEITKGKIQKSPEWYNQMVEALLDAQAPSGGWGVTDADSALSPEISTCFAILFLIRSTQKAIGTLNEAYYVGGIDLPDDLNSVRAVGGKIMSKTSTTSIDDALKMLEDDKKTVTEEKLVADKMMLSNDPNQKKEQLNRFVRLLQAKDPETRRIAAKMLGRGDELDMVPALIYAVSTDPDPEVPRIAEQSLRLISRQLETHHLPKDKGVKLSDPTKFKAGMQWKKWFSSLRPDYVFVD